MAPPAPDCRYQDNTRAEGMSGKMIYDLMTTGPGTGSLVTGSSNAAQLTTAYADIEKRLSKASATLGEGWTGASADAAQQAASPINKAVIEMQSALTSVDRSIDSQGVQFANNKGALKQLPDQKPESGFWNDVTPWETDTDRAIAGYNSDEVENRRLYTQYQGASSANRDQLPSTINGVTPDTLDVDIVDNSGTTVENPNGTGKYTNNQTGTSSWNGGTTQGTQGSVSTFTPPPGSTGQVGGTTTTSGNVGTPTLPPPSVPNPVPGQGPGGGLNNPNGGGFGLPPFGGPAGTQGGGRPGTGPLGGGRAAGGPPGGGRGSGGVPGGGSGRSGSGIGGGLGSGRPGGENGVGPGGKAGVVAPGEGAHGRGGFGPTGSAMAGRAGGAGAAGMGGMGGAKGQGDEDGEHKSADYLVNEDNGNEIVGDMPMTAPPVLGG